MPFGPVVRGLLLTFIAVLWTVGLVRLVGLRAFSKMNAFDLVATIATGSLIAQAGTRAVWSEYLQALAAIGGVFLLQWLIARARQESDRIGNLISNEPVLLMDRGEFLEAAMSETRVSRSNMLEKLRSAGVTDLSEVRAVVLETTGDISVIRGDRVDETMLEGVRRI
ncbi:MAG TPA: YetF domain-containing protein [Sphingomicrobium sp.]|nr:YetF domain-containing protein [Sphingomicrobium sp.]